MLTKLKYVGVSTQDLVDVFSLFIRFPLEYCCVVWHSTLTQEQSYDIERVQRTALKVILGEDYIDYQTSIGRCGLETLHSRRQKRCLAFGLRSLKHSKHKTMFQPSNEADSVEIRLKNKFHVNCAHKTRYKKSTIPFIQNMLNEHFRNKKPVKTK